MIARGSAARRGVLAAAASLATWSISGPRALASCTLAKLAELPVTMNGLTPTVPATINGANARFIVDSGAFYSTISPLSAARFNLHLERGYRMSIVGVGGATVATVATVSRFTLAGISFQNPQFLVGGSELGGDVAGLLGQNILRAADTEYDLANGTVRLWVPKGCRKTVLAYWVKDPKIQRLAMIDIKWTSAATPHIVGTAELNGRKIRVLFDSGAGRSLLARRAADRAGFRPDGSGVQSAGAEHGIGSQIAPSWIAIFAKLDLGGEEIRNARLRVSDLSIPDTDMLLGADFFLSHRIYIAVSQKKLYFTYNGGPVFDLSTAPLKQASNDVAPPPRSRPPPAAALAEPTDADGFSRRGMASAARGEFDRAIADLTRACELAPTQANYFYERAQVRLAAAQPRLALDDLNEVLKLDPNDAGMHVSRAELRLRERDSPGAVADIQAADRLSPKSADIRLTIARLYESAGLYAPAVTQFNLWFAGHGKGFRIGPETLNGRCWARALAGQELKQALGDCNAALRMRPGTAAFLDSRALVELRLGDFEKSIKDHDAALRAEPKNAWFLYSRGVAELRKGMKERGQQDIAAAVDVQPSIVDLARARDVMP